MSSTPSEEASLLDKLDTTPLSKFEAFPKDTFDVQGPFRVSQVYDIFVALLAFMLVVNEANFSGSLNSRAIRLVVPGKSLFKPMYIYEPAESACRMSGTLAVKRVTANLHITGLGHGYASFSHVDHKQMKFSHIVTEFSFGLHFLDIVQPLDDSFEATDKNFIAFQYFLHILL
ncbi:hypothetical protein BYT27DRAFT_7344158 [Phlegmacium glaucopus]|nr:hypothetical protein BYT27DRAFT_7344158 [Phlegmacium glaucopus]